MKIIQTTISDYYPLCYDIAETKETEFSTPEIINMGANNLLTWAFENQMTDLQILTLLIKNTFEGHLCHLNGYPVEKLIEFGTFHLELEKDCDKNDLTSDFFSNLPLYQEGLDLAWQNVISENPPSHEIDKQSMFYFILAYQLFKLPVSCLKGFDIQLFRNVSGWQKEQFRLQHIMYESVQDYVAHQLYFEIVDEKYYEQFKGTLMRLQSKQNVLMQLHSKLDYANDPSIRTEEELEKKYFEFLVAIDVLQTEKKKHASSIKLADHDEDHSSLAILKSQVKKLYKVISKNCSEVHNQIEKMDCSNLLNQYFIDANSVYNNLVTDFSSMVLQQGKLTLLLIKVINYRKINHLHIVFTDFTGINDTKLFKLKEKEVLIFKNKMKGNLEMQQLVHFTNYKLRYLKDEEMANFHRTFLNHKLEFLDKQIIEIINEIKLVMKNKSHVSSSL